MQTRTKRILVFGMAALGLVRSAPALASGPNIMLIIGDDIGVDNIAGYGEHADSAMTPRIDALASEGVLFRNAWSNPMCAPTRAGILTGRHAYRHGVLTVGSTYGHLDGSEETLAEVLSDVGYATALVGKWHLGTDKGELPTDQGFHYYAGNTSAAVDDYYDWERTIMSTGAAPLTVRMLDYATRVTTDDAITWLRAQTDPWFLTVAYNAAHTPFHVPPGSLLSWRTRASLNGAVGDPCDGTVDDEETCYRAMVEAMDSEVGRLLDWLTISGQHDDTLIIFVGDNGTPSNAVIDDGVFAKIHGKGTIYEGGVNVPMVMSGGANLGLLADVEESALVQVLDIFATVADMAGGSPAAELDAESLLGYLDGKTAVTERDYLYTELFADPSNLDRWTMRADNAKYLYNDGVEECYNLSRDPGEAVELYTLGLPETWFCDELEALRPCAAADSSDPCP